MSVTFAKAPLVELIAELRWVQPQQLGPNQIGAFGFPGQVFGLNPNKIDEFFMRFGGEIYQHGFNQAERIVPPGFPITLFQPVFRYRRGAEAHASVLFQVGPGVFSANAIRPYRSWETFSPIVQAGVVALLKTRGESEKALPFTSLSLRYVNAFGPELTGGRDIGLFVREVLGFAVALPEALTKHIEAGKTEKPSLGFSLPLSNGMSMNITIGEGLINNEASIIMDATVAATKPTAPDQGTLMAAFNGARGVIHEMFLDMTKPIYSLMQPEGAA
jgi:uncharacterized protein (TIGR04255 family)